MMDDQSGDAALPDSPFQPRNLAFPSREFGKASVERTSFRKVLGTFPRPLTGLICLTIYLYIKCKYTVSVLQVYFLPSTIALFFIYLQNVTSMFKYSTVLSCTMNNFGTCTRFFTSD